MQPEVEVQPVVETPVVGDVTPVVDDVVDTSEVNEPVVDEFDPATWDSFDFSKWDTDSEKIPENVRKFSAPLVKRINDATTEGNSLRELFEALKFADTIELEFDGEKTFLSVEDARKKFGELQESRKLAEVALQTFQTNLRQQEIEEVRGYVAELKENNKDIFDNTDKNTMFLDMISDKNDFDIDDALELVRNEPLRVKAVNLRSRGTPPDVAVQTAREMLAVIPKIVPSIAAHLTDGAEDSVTPSSTVVNENIDVLDHRSARQAAASKAWRESQK